MTKFITVTRRGVQAIINVAHISSISPGGPGGKGSGSAIGIVDRTGLIQVEEDYDTILGKIDRLDIEIGN